MSDSLVETYTLLVWEEVPEETSAFLIPNSVIDEKKNDLLVKSAGKFVNTETENKEVFRLTDMVAKIPEYCSPETLDEDKCCFTQYKVDISQPVEANITRVIHCGFVL